MLLALELLLSAIVLAQLGFGPLRTDHQIVTRLERYVSHYARRKHLAVVVILLLALGSRFAVLPVEPIPTPGIHDEFSYLLMSDTFAHGRLTNPPHPMWRHFETFHVNQQPTYCSKFFPAQGLFLAIGQMFFGHPFWGVWLSTGLMCAAICWALQGWMPPQWAFLGGILVILRLGIFSYWANSYWGGSVAALGGALVLGAWPRIKRNVRVRDAIFLALGLSILANSRPYEGLFYSLPILIALAIWLLARSELPVAKRLSHVALPLLAVLITVLLGMGYYFWRTTGTVLRTPYAVYSATYDAAPFFPWQTLKSIPPYDHSVMRKFYTAGFAMQQYRAFRDAPMLFVIGRAISFWLFFIGPALTLPIIVWLGVGRGKLGPNAGFLLLLNAIAFAASLPIVYFNPHYFAPMTAASIALLVFSIRRVWIWDRHGSGKGRFVVRSTVAICLLMALISARTAGTTWGQGFFFPSHSTGQVLARAQVFSRLQQEAGKHLVIVRYSANHDAHQEWVYNRADIDGSKVAWAREMGAEEDAKLIAYFKDRRVWLVEPDQQPPKLSPYPVQNRAPL